MKCLGVVLFLGLPAVVCLPCGAETNCTAIVVKSSVEVAPGDMTLADLLAPETCEPVRRAAALVDLGGAPGIGLPRVLAGSEVGELLDVLAEGNLKPRRAIERQIPERVSIREAGARKSCAEFASFVAGAVAAEEIQKSSSRWLEKVDCAAAPSIAEATPLELLKTSWSAALDRWEFNVRCARPEDCVPFLLWARDESASRAREPTVIAVTRKIHRKDPEGLVKRGQTVILIWDGGGIRIVLPVTCLDAGLQGQFVRAQFKNAPRIVRAEVLADGTLRASL